MRWPRIQGRRSAVARLDDTAGSNPDVGLGCCVICCQVEVCIGPILRLSVIVKTGQ
jgi:hypothetical protein